MSKKHHGGPGPVPPANRQPQFGGSNKPEDEDDAVKPSNEGTGFQEEDPQRRLGDFTGTGEHSRVQPGPLNDGDKHSK